MRLILKWLVTAAALYVAATLLSGIEVADQRTLLIAALVIGFVNALVKPVVVLLTLPLSVVDSRFSSIWSSTRACWPWQLVSLPASNSMGSGPPFSARS